HLSVPDLVHDLVRRAGDLVVPGRRTGDVPRLPVLAAAASRAVAVRDRGGGRDLGGIGDRRCCLGDRPVRERAATRGADRDGGGRHRLVARRERMTDTMSDPITPAISIRRVTKRFGDITAVDDLTIDIREGEFLTLLGPSGCGKTTTMRMVA